MQQLCASDKGNIPEEALALINNLVLVSRNDMDFPDRLWDILKGQSAGETCGVLKLDMERLTFVKTNVQALVRKICLTSFAFKKPIYS